MINKKIISLLLFSIVLLSLGGVAAASNETIEDVEALAAGDPAYGTADVAVEVFVEESEDYGDGLYGLSYSVTAYNYGPDVATNVYVDVYWDGILVDYYDLFGYGEFYVEYEGYGYWYFPYLYSDEGDILWLETIAYEPGFNGVCAVIEADQWDPDLSDNIDYDGFYIGETPEKEAKAAKTVSMEPTGNPIALILLLFGIVPVLFTRKKF